MKVALIAIAGAAGALCRWGLGVAIGVRSFPWTTLGINLTGSLILGFIVAFSTERRWSSTPTLPITIGFLGAYTTFSTFSYETFKMIDDDRAVQGRLRRGVSARRNTARCRWLHRRPPTRLIKLTHYPD